MAAALAIALAAFGLGSVAGVAESAFEDSLSSVANEAPTTTPLMTKSPLKIAPDNPVAGLTDDVARILNLAPTELSDGLPPSPMSLVLTDPKPMAMVSPLFTPVCSVILPAEPSNSLMLLWLVLVATLLISAFIWSTSNCKEARSAVDMEPLTA